MKASPPGRLRQLFERRGSLAALLAILLAASVLRLARLELSPPIANVDEAANVWNAYCLLQTGQDQHGVRWPIFYTRGYGANRSTLFLYMLLPFEAVGGLTVPAGRWASAVGGVLTVLLVCLVVARLFGRPAGLLAAGLLAVNPWHLQQSRWAHEAAVTPLLVVLPLAAALWAGLPIAGEGNARPRAWRAALAGVVGGICCYGYPVVRLFLPVFFAGAVLVNWRAWWNRIRTRSGAAAIAAFLAGLLATFSPLAWKHLTDPEMSRRAETARWVWGESDPAGTKIGKVLARYPAHFGPSFLFQQGDAYPPLSPPKGFGLFHWYMAPLMIAGAVVLLGRVRSSSSARVLAAWLILYPCGDLLNEHLGPHSLRSLPGVCALVILAAVGAAGAGRWLYRRRRRFALALALALAAVVVILNVRFLHVFYGEFNREPDKYLSGQQDLLAASRWLAPRWNDYDAVFWTTLGTNQPYTTTLVGLRYSPRQWFADVRDVVRHDAGFDVYTRCGKMHFMYGDSWRPAMRQLERSGRPHRVVFIVRPGQFAGRALPDPVHEVCGPAGQPRLRMYEMQW